ncbi:MAG: glycosyltransferase family 8 protein [Desulfovermiculus sp.]|nr:glycosyltransferase family 8 protein [Desulfovermiculus sp.]
MNEKNETRSLNSGEAIPIVVSSDENYAPHVGVMFASLLENASRPESCHLFVIDAGISEKTHKRVEDEVHKRKGNISFIPFDGEMYEKFPLRRGMTAAAYYRLSIPELFDEKVTKVIYLDCDLIVQGDIAELWNHPLDGKHIAAVQDLSNSTHLASGLPQNKYFNSGVMLIDLELWRRDDIAQKVRRFKMEHPERIQTNDQCALNGVLYDSWSRLPLRWNQQAGIYRPGRGRLRAFSQEEIEEGIWNPGIIHYIGSKPWNYPCFHPLTAEYYRYLEKTVWAGAEPNNKGFRAFLRWSSRPQLVKKFIRQLRWQRRYARHKRPRDQGE